MTDDQRVQGLVEQAAKGDRKAFSELVRQFMKPIAALTYRMTGNREAANDLAQDTFVAAWQNLTGFRGDAKFESWLYRIASNKTLNYLNARKESHLSDAIASRAAAPEAVRPDREYDRRQLQQGVLEFMDTLPPQQRLVFDLRFYRQLPFKEIAKILDSAEGTVKTHYRQAVAKLRDHAASRGWN